MKGQTIFFSGTSMFPFLKAGDRIHVLKTPWHRLRIGDLVVVVPGKSVHPIVHRLVGWHCRNHRRLGILKGDSVPGTDDFFLTRQNYLGRVWALERNGKRLQLVGFRYRTWARIIVFLSVFNLTPGVVRLKVVKEFKRILPKIPGFKNLESRILKKTRFFFFSGQKQEDRLLATYRGKTIGEIILPKDLSRADKGEVFSVNSPVISAAKLAAHAAEKFPQLFL